MEREKVKPVCLECSDTHVIVTEARAIMCTRCPLPCGRCGDNSPYCAATPCSCECHTHETRDWADEAADNLLMAIKLKPELSKSLVAQALRRACGIGFEDAMDVVFEIKERLNEH
jgi:hypothetical protein